MRSTERQCVGAALITYCNGSSGSHRHAINRHDLIAYLKPWVALRLANTLQIGRRSGHHIDDDVVLITHEAEAAARCAHAASP